MSTQLDIIKTLGREWRTADGTHQRVYFTNLYGLYELEVERYGSGNVSSAKLDGMKITNTAARHVCTCLDFATVYYDVVAGTYGSTGLVNSQFIKIVAAIQALIKKEEASYLTI